MSSGSPKNRFCVGPPAKKSRERGRFLAGNALHAANCFSVTLNLCVDRVAQAESLVPQFGHVLRVMGFDGAVNGTDGLEKTERHLRVNAGGTGGARGRFDWRHIAREQRKRVTVERTSVSAYISRVASPIVTGVIASALVSGAARRMGMLTGGGMVAATVIGAGAVGAGWTWAALLLGFFVFSIAWTRVGAAEKARRSSGRVAKPHARDAVQVLANGGVFAVGTFIMMAIAASDAPATMSGAMAAPANAAVVHAVAAGTLGALAAACADTWATEVGMLSRSAPRSIFGGAPVAAGTSGGVTALGTFAGCGGALAIAAGAMAGGIDRGIALAGFAGGITGMFVDSALGASVQGKRVCLRCGESTERLVHTCGTSTRHTGGLSWLNNDGVNAVATMAGAATAISVRLTVGA